MIVTFNDASADAPAITTPPDAVNVNPNSTANSSGRADRRASSCTELAAFTPISTTTS